MQPHDMKGRQPDNDNDNPDPSSWHTRLLLLVIAILGGALDSQLLSKPHDGRDPRCAREHVAISNGLACSVLGDDSDVRAFVMPLEPNVCSKRQGAIMSKELSLRITGENLKRYAITQVAQIEREYRWQ